MFLTELDRRVLKLDVPAGTRQEWRLGTFKKHWDRPNRYGREFMLVPRDLILELPERFHMSCPVKLKRPIRHAGGRVYQRECHQNVEFVIGVSPPTLGALPVAAAIAIVS